MILGVIFCRVDRIFREFYNKIKKYPERTYEKIISNYFRD